MFNHLLGKIHLEKFFQRKYDVEQGKYSPAQLKSMAEKERENEQIDEKINTIYSDELYPWPSGKAPWSLEKGGTGEHSKYNPTSI